MTARPTRIPPAPLALGLAGLIPFLWGAATHLSPDLATAMPWPAFSGQRLLVTYGLTILAFMSGVIWGFATRSPNPAAAWGFVLSVLPALWGLFVFSAAPALACAAIAAGFIVLLALDFRAVRLAEAPHWWLPLRLILTSVASISLLVGAFG